MRRPHIKPLHDLLDILFPRHCCCCDTLLVGGERHICTHCIAHLPYTRQAAVSGNRCEQLFAPYPEVISAMSLFYYRDDLPSRNIVHDIKYRGNEQLALTLGRMMGDEIAASNRFDDVTVIVPVPLHRRKERQRGYNQSELLCRGLAERFPRPIMCGNLWRTVNTESQTHKTSEERKKNVAGVFALRDPDAFKGKHLLLVDDVITTGSTTMACCDILQTVPGIQISIATLAQAAI